MHPLVLYIFLGYFLCPTDWKHATVPSSPATCYKDSITETDSTLCAGLPCVVWFPLSETQTDSLHQAMGDEDFYTVMDDYNWYFSEVSDLLEARHIPLINANQRRIQFISAENGKLFPEIIPQSGQMLFYNGHALPVAAYPVEATAVCDSLFGKNTEK